MLGLFKRKPAAGAPEIIVHDEQPWPDHYYEVHSVVTEQPKDPTLRHFGGLHYVTWDKADAIARAQKLEAEYRAKGDPFAATVAEWPTSRERLEKTQEKEAVKDFLKRERVVGIRKRAGPHEFDPIKLQWNQTRSECGACGLYKRFADLGYADREVGGYQVCKECHALFAAEPEKLAEYRARVERERYDGYALRGWVVDFSDRNELGYVRFDQGGNWDRRFDYPVHLRDGKGLITSGSTRMQFPDGRWAEWIHEEDEQGRKFMHAGTGPWDQPIPGETWWVKLHKEPWHHEAPKPEYRIVWPEQNEAAA